MPHFVRLPFAFATFASRDRARVMFPVLYPETLWICADAERLVRAFRDTAERHLLRRGRLSALLPDVTPLSFRRIVVRVAVPAAEDGWTHPAMEIDLDGFVAPLAGGGGLGFVPVLGLEAYLPKVDLGAEVLRQAARQEFARHGRVGNPRRLLEVMAAGACAVETRMLDLPFHSPAEVAEMQTPSAGRLLPTVATEPAGGEPRVFGREEEVGGVLRALAGPFRRSVLLTGPSGCGKSAVVEAARAGMRTEEGLRALKVWETTAARLVQRLHGPAGWQEALAQLVRELRGGTDLLWVRNLSDLFEVGQYSGNDQSVAEALRGPLARGEITILAELTPAQAARIDLRAPGYREMFAEIRVVEPAGPKLESIVRRRAQADAEARGVALDPTVADEALALLRRYHPYSGFPGKAVRFLETALDAVPGDSRPRVLGRADIIRRFCADSGMPASMIDPETPLDLLALEAHVRGNVFGQPDAVGTVVDMLAAVKAGLTRPGKPIAALLFVGPTGVGKTEMTKVLAEFMFGGRERLLRFDMSEYADEGAVLRLTDGPGGGGDGLLTGAVTQEPFSVLLFDEVEKAHPVFFDLLLQVLGEGRLTDGRGRTADFCSTIIVMTSNLGAETLPHGAVGFGGGRDPAGEVTRHFLATVEAHFRPEFFNRLDRVVAFAPLTREAIRRVVDRELGQLRLRPGLRWRPVEVVADEDALERLGEAGYDPVWGARQLQRAFRDLLVAPLARRMSAIAPDVPLRARLKVVGDGVAVAFAEGPEDAAGGAACRRIAIGRADAATAVRVEAARVASGGAVSKLESAAQVLRLKRAALSPGDWSKTALARDLERLEDLLACWEIVHEDAHAVEADTLLPLLSADLPAAGNLDVRLAGVQDDLRDIELRLADHANPDDRRCVIGIFGRADALPMFTDLYAAVAPSLGLVARARHVCWVPSRRALASGPIKGDDHTVVGTEILFEGPGAWPALSQEGGLVEVSGFAGGPLPVRVLVARGGLAEFEPHRPEDAHRRKPVPGLKARREFSAHALKDIVYGIEAAFGPHVAVLSRTLLARRRAEVLACLIP